MALFGGKLGGKQGSAGSGAGTARISRHSSGWVQMAKHLRSREALRILDIGPTSAGNINFITNLGHSIYMANLVEDAARPEYVVARTEGPDAGKNTYDIARFLKENLDFAGRVFDVVTLWDTADYLPEPLVRPVVDRLYDVLEPGGQLLAFFHAKMEGSENSFSRYHLTPTDQLEMQRIGTHPILHTYTTRQIETLFQRYASHRFFLAKDTLREVIVVR
jgi:SAM-dependent methyltransferase